MIWGPADSVKTKTGKIAELFVYDNFNRVPAEQVEAGDICAFTGLSDVGIGETVCARDAPNALPTIEVGPPPALILALYCFALAVSL